MGIAGVDEQLSQTPIVDETTYNGDADANTTTQSFGEPSGKPSVAELPLAPEAKIKPKKTAVGRPKECIITKTHIEDSEAVNEHPAKHSVVETSVEP